ncbi:MAG: replication initiation protein [Lachnospiraceae bacterium]
MAQTKKKKAEVSPLVGNLKDTYEVQKSNPLFSLWKSDLTLQEFKILDTYLSRIDSHNPEQRCVRFEKGEMESILGVTKINQKDLEDRLKHLMGYIVELKDPNKKKGFALVVLFEKALCEKDENEQWQIDLECTQSAMEYFFNIEDIGYLRYKLRNVIALTSRYSYIMFMYIESNRYRKSWEVGVDELKVVLNCEKEESYSEYKRFNDLILKRCHKELTEKTELRYTYEPVRKGRKIVKIRFTVETLKDVLDIVQAFAAKKTLPSLPEDEPDKNEESEFYKKDIDFYREACENAFTYEEMDAIFAVVSQIHLPPHQFGEKIARYHYLAEKYSLFKLVNAKQTIKNKFSYFLAMINNDREKQQ